MQSHSMPREGFTRPTDAAAFFGVSLATYWRWAKAHKVPRPIPLSGNVSAVRNADLLDCAADPTGWAARQQQALQS